MLSPQSSPPILEKKESHKCPPPTLPKKDIILKLDDGSKFRDTYKTNMTKNTNTIHNYVLHVGDRNTEEGKMYFVLTLCTTFVCLFIFQNRLINFCVTFSFFILVDTKFQNCDEYLQKMPYCKEIDPKKS